MERNKELRDTVKSALIYPTILVCVAVASVILLLSWVVPQFESTFAQAGKALPVPTQVVIFVGKFLKEWWWAMLGVVVLALAWFRRRGNDPSFDEIAWRPLMRVRARRFLRWAAPLPSGDQTAVFLGGALVQRRLRRQREQTLGQEIKNED
jgi:type II secretory pathway component PulF